MTTAFRIGLFGHGTVGAAFVELLESRAGEVEAVTGLRP
jgi:homoserine dehydrogenase